MRASLRLVASMGWICLSPGVAGAQVPAGGEFQVNTYTTGDQIVPHIASLGGGGFVVVWDSAAQSAIVGRRHDAAGTPLGAEIQESVPSAYLRGLPSVAAYGAGRFVVTWTLAPTVMARRYDAAGLPLGSPMPVTSPPPMFYVPTTSHVSAAADGSFVVGASFFSGHSPVEPPFYLFNLFDRSDAPVCSTGTRSRPESAFLPDGGFVGVSTLRTLGFPPPVAQYQRFDRACVGPFLPLNTNTTLWAVDPSVAANANGDFVVAWASGPEFASSDTILARRFNAAGTPVGAELQVSAGTTNVKRLPSVGIAGDGSFQVAWESAGQDGSGAGIFARRFAADGTPREPEFQVNTYTTGAQSLPRVAADPNGNFVVAWQSAGQDGSGAGVFAQRFGGLRAAALAIDDGGNDVLEAGETATVSPSWRNVNGAAQTFGGSASSFTGPGAPGDPTYTLSDAVAAYGTVANGVTASCTATGDCYGVAVSVPTTRPAPHWDARLAEEITPGSLGLSQVWSVHLGGSFSDVPASNPFYRFVETLLHRGVTGGCAADRYCPESATTREQMAVFVVVAKEGAGYAPRACGTPVFPDVPASSAFCPWIEELARRGVVSGCGGGLYCPQAAVSREEMAVFVLRTLDPALSPPPCAAPPMFGDVPPSSSFCRWIEELARRAVVTGCGNGNYCPTAPVTREQMGVFIAVTFGLTLYGP
jgi:hypothetical protein